MQSDSMPSLTMLNILLNGLLPESNNAICSKIKEQHLDPWQNVASGSVSPGDYCVDIPLIGRKCAGVEATWGVTNLTGLSQLEVSHIAVTNLKMVDTGKIAINVHLSAGLNTLSGNITGIASANVFDIIHPSVSLSGGVKVPNISMSTSGTIEAPFSDNGVTLESISISQPTINTGDLDVSINGLGVFESLVDPLVDLVTNDFKSDIINLLSNKLTPVLNNEFKSILPITEKF